MSSTWVSLGELLSGGSYIMTACLFTKHATMSNGSSRGVPPSTSACPVMSAKSVGDILI